MTRRVYEHGPGFVRAVECPDCGHTTRTLASCGESCVCNCDAARAEHELARVRAERDALLAELARARAAALEEAARVCDERAARWSVPPVVAYDLARGDEAVTCGAAIRALAAKGGDGG